MRLAVYCYPMLISKCLIFVQEKLQRDELEPIIEKDAKIRAEITKAFFEEDLKFDDVKIHMNNTKQEVIQIFDNLQKESDKFEEENKDDY